VIAANRKWSSSGSETLQHTLGPATGKVRLQTVERRVTP